MPYKTLAPDQLRVLNALYIASVPQRWSGEIAEIANILVRRKLAIKSGKPKGYSITEFGAARLLMFLREKNGSATR